MKSFLQFCTLTVGFLFGMWNLPAQTPDTSTPPASPKVVLLDNFFHHQLRAGKRYHYTWDDTTASGYSSLGALFTANGGQIDFLTTAPTRELLQHCSVYIVVTPDNEEKATNHHPNYITPEAADVIEEWVRAGGSLMLMNNDKANAEFEHFNILAQRFGITFNADTRNEAPNHEPAQMQFDTKAFASNPILQNVNRISMRLICTLSVQDPAKVILTAPKEVGVGTDNIMVTSQVGKGRVFALGDPWLYNEYIHTVDNFQAAQNLVHWLLDGGSNPVSQISLDRSVPTASVIQPLTNLLTANTPVQTAKDQNH